MKREEFIELCRNEQVAIDSNDKSTDLAKWMNALAHEAQDIVIKLNNDLENKNKWFAKLFEIDLDPSFTCFLPFHTDYGKNTKIGKHVFINSNCNFQDRGGIEIGDNALIGMNVNIATLNHGLEPNRRSWTIPSKVVIGRNVWIGSGVTILPGVTIGENTIVAAGAVLTKDAEPNAIYAGVPAKKIKQLPSTNEHQN